MKNRRRTILIALFMGAVTAFCYEVGARIGAEGADRVGSRAILVGMVWKTALCSILVYLSFTALPAWCDRWRSNEKTGRIRTFLKKADEISLPFWLLALLIFLMWLPVFLSIFPGAFAYDAPTQWEQFTTGQLSAHHPVFHTLMIGVCLEGGARFLGSYNAGIAVYTVIQMIILACIFAYSVRFMWKYRVPFLLRFFAVLFWGLSPVVQLFAVSSTKDGLFSGVFLLFLLSLIDLRYCRKAFWDDRRKIALFALSTIGMIVLRNNGLYIVAAVFVLMLLMGPERKKQFRFIVFIAVFYMLYTGPFYRLLHVERGEICEMLCVPLQQMARVYMYDHESLEAEDIALLEQLIPKEDLLNYLPTLADNVKRNFREDVFREHAAAYCRLWVKWGVEHPWTYVQSFLINTSDYWYPHAVVDGYDPGRDKIDFFYFSVGEPGKRIEMLPRIHERYRALSEERYVSEKPFLFLWISPGWYLLMTMYMAAGFWNGRKKEFLLPCAALAVAEMTALLGPVAQVRYVLILFLAYPVLSAFYVDTFLLHSDP